MTQIDKSRFEWIGSDSARREGISRPSTTFWKDAIGRLMKNKVAVVCFFIIVLLILSCIIAVSYTHLSGYLCFFEDKTVENVPRKWYNLISNNIFSPACREIFPMRYAEIIRCV